MIVTTGVCIDCGAYGTHEIRIDNSGWPYWMCPECGVLHEDYSWYRSVSPEEMNEIIRTGGKQRSCYICNAGVEVICVDNRMGENEYEEFPDMEECLIWLLRGEYKK